MNKILLSLVLVVSAVAPSFADQFQGKHPGYYGYRYVTISSTAETIVCSGRCLLAQIYPSTGAIGSKITVRDTSVADGLATGQMFPIRAFAPQTAVPLMDAPIRTANGINVKLNAASNGETVTVLFLDDL